MLTIFTSLMATSQKAKDLPKDLFPWLGLLVALIVVGAIVIFCARRAMYRENADAPPQGFTLHGLRELHASGALSDEEFEHARQSLIAKVKGPAAAVGESDNEAADDQTSDN